jgi:hypothetical protein
MITNNYFKAFYMRLFTFLILTLSFISLNGSISWAAFEWVPAEKLQKPEKKPDTAAEKKVITEVKAPSKPKIPPAPVYSQPIPRPAMQTQPIQTQPKEPAPAAPYPMQPQTQPQRHHAGQPNKVPVMIVPGQAYIMQAPQGAPVYQVPVYQVSQPIAPTAYGQPASMTPLPSATTPQPVPVMKQIQPLQPPQEVYNSPAPVMVQQPAVNQQSMPAPASMPVQNTPLQIQAYPAQATTTTPPVWGKGIEEQPQAAQPLPQMPAQPYYAMPQQTAANYPQAVGFGNDIPLALALRQIVPANYAFAFAQSINPGIRVSWNGGKPWDQVLNEMVSPLGMSAQIINKTIYIKKTM